MPEEKLTLGTSGVDVDRGGAGLYPCELLNPAAPSG